MWESGRREVGARNALQATLSEIYPSSDKFELIKTHYWPIIDRLESLFSASEEGDCSGCDVAKRALAVDSTL